MRYYRRRRPRIEAVQWKGEDTDFAALRSMGIMGRGLIASDGSAEMRMGNGIMLVRVNDWIVRTPDGSGCFVYEPEAFAAVYEEVPE